jgi:hypothetical protein
MENMKQAFGGCAAALVRESNNMNGQRYELKLQPE